MRSAAKLSYAQAQAAADGRTDDVTGPLATPVLEPLYAAYAVSSAHAPSASPSIPHLPGAQHFA